MFQPLKAEEVQYVDNVLDLYCNDTKTGKPYYFTCNKCGRVYIIKRFDRRDIKSYELMMCRNCKVSYLNLSDGNSRYNKMKETVERKYGVDNVFKLDEFQQKAKQSKLELYGDENYVNISKMKETVERKYGVDNVFKLDEFQQKAKQSKLELYGVNHALQLIKFKNKAMNTTINRYGKQRISYRFCYNGILFDSAPELCFWIYCKDHGAKIYREPNAIKYMFDGNYHDYYPDFYIGGKYVEIKGDHFFKDKNTHVCDLVDPFDETKNRQQKAKLKCMEDNDVIIINSTNKIVVDSENYVKTTYGEGYINTFKLEKTKKQTRFKTNCLDYINQVGDKFSLTKTKHNLGYGYTPFEVYGEEFVGGDSEPIIPSMDMEEICFS